MEMSNLASKLKSLKLEFSEELLMHLVLISLLAHYREFKDKLSLNELIHRYVQQERRLHREKAKIAHFVLTPQNKKRKNTKGVMEDKDTCRNNALSTPYDGWMDSGATTHISVTMLKLNFNLESKLKSSNFIVVVNTMVDMKDQKNNVQSLLHIRYVEYSQGYKFYNPTSRSSL
ncbi:hypothetical protein CR513_33737, partial [Mucuna pruriens]